MIIYKIRTNAMHSTCSMGYWSTSHDRINGNSIQRLYSPCTQTINQIIFTINGHLVPIEN